MSHWSIYKTEHEPGRCPKCLCSLEHETQREAHD